MACLISSKTKLWAVGWNEGLGRTMIVIWLTSIWDHQMTQRTLGVRQVSESALA
ncbi:MAG: hypothetical protein WBQ05_10635 [Candidatus Competibacter denitrificans]